MIKTENGRVVDDNGMVAIRCFPPTAQPITVPGGAYMFEIRRNVCMVWVHPAHADIILNTTKQCCGGQLSRPFRLASESDARIWLNLSER